MSAAINKRHRGDHIDQRIARQHDVVAEINKDQRNRRQSHEGVNEAAAKKDTEPVCEITHRLGEKRIDLAFANIGSDLPFILRWGDQIADQDNEQIVVNHRAIVVAVEPAAALLEHRGPKKNCAGQRDQAKQRAQKIIPAVNKRVL